MKPLSKSIFSIDGGERFRGYTRGNHWNGWACPMFTKEEGLKIIKAFTTEEYPMYYDEIKDAFVVQYEEGDYDVDNPEHKEMFYIFEAMDVEGL